MNLSLDEIGHVLLKACESDVRYLINFENCPSFEYAVKIMKDYPALWLDNILGFTFNILEEYQDFHADILAFLSVNFREKSSNLISFIFDDKFELFWKKENSKHINWLNASNESADKKQFFDFIIDFLSNVLKSYYSGEFLKGYSETKFLVFIFYFCVSNFIFFNF